MPVKLTAPQLKALTILSRTDWQHPLPARAFALSMWGDTDTNMFTSSKNTGNGATRGKAAWLCGGSYLGKLAQKGWVHWTDHPTGYYITEKGRQALKESQLMPNSTIPPEPPTGAQIGQKGADSPQS